MLRIYLVVLIFCGIASAAGRPNAVLMMADDMGYGDVGFNGGKIIKTPHLDAMAEAGLKFTRFYAAAPVCSPTRGSCLTGRHPFRYGIYNANVGHMKPPEISLAELLRKLGYATGHFGKWHLGTLAEGYSGKGDRRAEGNYSPPDRNGFDEWFSTEYAVATWDPYDPNNAHGQYDVRNLYWHNGHNVTQKLEGDDSRIIMDRAIPFIEGAVNSGKPFFAVIWFHAPHEPIVGGPKYRAMYGEHPENEQHYYACVTAMDEQVGRLRKKLRDLGVAENTMLFFTSDNGPARQGGQRQVGSPGPYRGFKTQLYEGGVRVPGLLEWPAKIKGGSVTDYPASTSDYLPTILEVVGVRMPDARPIDGVSLMPVVEKQLDQRPRPIGFQQGNQCALTDNRYKIFSRDRGKSWQLYDLLKDPAESNDIAAEHPQVIKSMRERFNVWRDSCEQSGAGADYPKID